MNDITSQDQLNDHLQKCFDLMSFTMIRISKIDNGSTYDQQKRNIKQFILDVNRIYGVDLVINDTVKNYYDLYNDS